MDTSGTNRLANLSPDNHAPWLWVVHIFSICFVLLGACLRVYTKWRNVALSDALWLVAHMIYLGYWITLLLALVNKLGKSEKLTTDAQQSTAATLVFASRIVFVVILSLTKVSAMYLVQEIFTREATKWWFRAILIMAAAQAVIGSLLIAIDCTPSSMLDGAENNKCPGNVARWISFSVLEALLEAFLIIPVVVIVMNLQTSFQRKTWAITVFICRLVIWIPLWIHLSVYINFLQHGRPNIDIVPTMVTEELWTALALVSSSIPVLMRVAKKLTTGGIAFSPGSRYGYDYYASRKGSSKQNSSQNRKSIGFRPDDVNSSSQIDAHIMRVMKAPNTANSRADSQVGILRHVDFQVSSEDRVPEK